MDLVECLYSKEYINYKGLDLLKKLVDENQEFKMILGQGMLQKKVTGFTSDVWSKIRSQNIRRIRSFEDVFKDGANIGYCTVASKQLSYSFDNVEIAGGTVDFLKKTKNSENGEHTWMVCDRKIYDTSLMLIIDERFSKKMGYNEENRYDPTKDKIYLSTKEFTLDSSLRKEESLK